KARRLEAIGRLAGGIAHDFNNMLSVILGVGGILRAEIGQSDPRLADLDEILGAATRASELTQQLLTFARRQTLNPHSVDVCKMIERIERMLQHLIGEQVALLRGNDQCKKFAYVDEGQLEQVVVNLAINARDAM